MSRTLFVLGGTGFIGREVVQEAVAAGYAVRALARSDDSATALAAAGAEPVRGDAAKPADYRYPSYREGVRQTLADLGELAWASERGNPRSGKRRRLMLAC